MESSLTPLDEPEPELKELTDAEVAAAARSFWLDELCEHRDRQHEESEIPYET